MVGRKNTGKHIVFRVEFSKKHLIFLSYNILCLKFDITGTVLRKEVRVGMRNVAVIEDEKSASDALGQHLKRYGAETGEEFKIYVFPDAETFLQNYKADYDVVFMDIELPGMNGMTAARELRKLDGKVVLVFVTNMSQFAVGGYEVGAFDFILKPVNYSSFFLTDVSSLRR